MDILLGSAIGAFIVTIFFVLYFNGKGPSPETNEQLAEANRKIGDLQSRVLDYSQKHNELIDKYNQLGEEFKNLRHQKISADVKMGQKSENLLPFLSSFPYADDEIRGLFNPIDLIVFRDEEVVFVEVKSGQSQLSEKQRKIRDNIKEGRVRFEIHRMDEKGVKIK